MNIHHPIAVFLIAAYRKLISVGNLLQSLVLLVFRLTWGWQFFQNGKGKLMHHADIVQFFASLHIPYPDLNAWFVSGLECFGGLFLLAGLCSRPVALLLSINMIVAYLSVDDDRAKVLNIFHDLDSFVQADPFFFLLTAVLVLAFGPGWLSLDTLIGFVVGKKLAGANTAMPADPPAKRI